MKVRTVMTERTKRTEPERLHMDVPSGCRTGFFKHRHHTLARADLRMPVWIRNGAGIIRTGSVTFVARAIRRCYISISSLVNNPSLNSRKVAIGVTGGIAAYKAIEVLRGLQRAGCE